MTFITKSGDGISHLWASVRPEHLTINSEDLTMKFGSVLDGLWQVVGIVDARAGEPAQPWPVNPFAIYSPIGGLAESEAVAVYPPDGQ
jgi:hypothetical protein